eukprot:TRINITY_DN5637_c0_g1_i1.p1 TRINITY_DN5637_c0_g1~~TRINITY_DN5637_c0_g1_i1.p1  ORF type:complete len:275 (+),score=86.37 TRINITY_DN5637_c0_g1_i1:36-827(+)
MGNQAVARVRRCCLDFRPPAADETGRRFQPSELSAGLGGGAAAASAQVAADESEAECAAAASGRSASRSTCAEPEADYDYALVDLEDEPRSRAAEQREEDVDDEEEDLVEEAIFCGRWNMTEDAKLQMMRLSPDSRKLAMETFPEHYKKVGGKFVAFAKSLLWKQALKRCGLERGGDFCDEGGEEATFSLRWNMTEDSTVKLLSLSPDMRQLAMETFPEHYKKVGGKFIAFANSLLWKQAECAAAAASSGRSASAELDDVEPE